MTSELSMVSTNGAPSYSAGAPSVSVTDMRFARA